MNFYPNYNQFYGQPMPNMQQMQPMQQMQRQMEQPQQYVQQQMYKPTTSLQGKSVDSIDVVKAMDIPLDGTISYFPLVDGSAIVTKQLQQDGTSKTVTYKPIENKDENNEHKVPKYLTLDEFNKSIKEIDNNGLKEQIGSLKDQIEDIINDIKEIKDNTMNFKKGRRD